MIVLSYGITKSGSTLAFELCKAVLEKRGRVQRRLPDDVVLPGHHINFQNDLSVEVLERLTKATAPEEIIAIKLHAAVRQPEIEFIESQVARGQMKVHVNFRDPREICLSLVDAGNHARSKQRKAFSEIVTVDDAASTLLRQLGNCRRWGSIRGALHLFYNEVAFNTESAVRRMCEDLGLEMLSDIEYREAMDSVNNEAFTQRNRAVKDRYKLDMTAAQNDEFLANYPIFRRFIERVCVQGDYSWFTDDQESFDERGARAAARQQRISLSAAAPNLNSGSK